MSFTEPPTYTNAWLHAATLGSSVCMSDRVSVLTLESHSKMISASPTPLRPNIILASLIASYSVCVCMNGAKWHLGVSVSWQSFTHVLSPRLDLVNSHWLRRASMDYNVTLASHLQPRLIHSLTLPFIHSFILIEFLAFSGPSFLSLLPAAARYLVIISWSIPQLN